MNEIDAFYQKQLEDFLRPHFESSDDLAYFLSDVFDYKNGSVVKRQMLYQTQRFVSLANNIEKISPNSDGLKILFLKICIESLRTLSNCPNSFYDVFCGCFSNEGERYILSHFPWPTFNASRDMTLSDFLYVIKAIRDRIVHNGEHWSALIFARDEDSIWLSSIKSNEKKLRSPQNEQSDPKMIEYHFKTTLNYEKFIFYFVEACINYIRLATTETSPA